MQSVCIIGASFGRGEFSLLPQDVINNPNHKGADNFVSHKGTEVYLSDSLDYKVPNYAETNASLDDIIQQISKHDLKNKTLIIFATDVFRHFKKRNDVAMQLFVKRKMSLKKIHEMLYLDWTKRLEQVIKQRNCKVLLIGAYSNVYKSYQPCDQVKVVTHSWISDVLGKSVGNLSGVYYKDIEFLLSLTPTPTDDQKTDIGDILAEKAYRLFYTKNHTSFPDNYHPDRQAHKKLSEKILTLLA